MNTRLFSFVTVFSNRPVFEFECGIFAVTFVTSNLQSNLYLDNLYNAYTVLNDLVTNQSYQIVRTEELIM
jgi:hypothetical protein